MLTKRQIEILNYYGIENNNFLTASQIAKHLMVSERTINNELKEIRNLSKESKAFKIVSKRSLGSKLVIDDLDAYKLFIKNSISNEKSSLDTSFNRVRIALSNIIMSPNGISLPHLETRLFVSRSTLMQDLVKVRELLEKYSLELINNQLNGLIIIGDEVNIRRCIIREEIQISNSFRAESNINGHLSLMSPKISEIVISVLTQCEYNILNVSLQNLIIHLDISIFRIMSGFSLEGTKILEKLDLDEELVVARRILGKCEDAFNLKINENEIYRIAIYLKGKSNYGDDSYITEDIDNFVLSSLKVLEQKYKISFIDNIQLRISLALHILPLKLRLKYNMQQENQLLKEIRNNFQFSFDVASLFCLLLQEKEGIKISEDEVAFFALYFNNAIEESKDNKGKNKILVVTSQRRSESLLMISLLKNELSDHISEVQVVDYHQISQINIEEYSLVCTTNEDYIKYLGSDSILISAFPTKNDFKTIIQSMHGFSNKENFMSRFKKENTIIGSYKCKELLLKDLTALISSQEDTQYDLLEQVLTREEMGGTYYGNGIAMPHTLHPITKNTYIAVGLLEGNLIWDQTGNLVNLVILIFFEKNHPEVFKLWANLSPLISDDDIIENILKDLTYENFIKQMEITYNRSI